jgi:VCBS repeat-containing protein
LSYTPAANAFGTATITLILSDNGGTANGGVNTSPAQSFTITVSSVNDPPVAQNDARSTNEGTPLAGAGVLGNDTDGDGDPLTATLVNGPANAASFTLNANGTFSYTPSADFFGSDSFTYRANDGNANSNVATVTITVNAVNDAPSFTKGPNQTVNEDAGAQTVNPWATGISRGPANESGQTLAFNITGNTNPGLFSAGPAVSPAGVLTYTPAANAFGTATVTLILSDNGGTANGGDNTSAAQSFTVTVNPIDDLPALNYADDVQPIFSETLTRLNGLPATTCIGCHTGASPSGGLNLNASATTVCKNLKAAGSNGSRINTGTPANSLILTNPSSDEAEFHSGGKFDSFSNPDRPDYNTIFNWIAGTGGFNDVDTAGNDPAVCP